MLSNTCTELRRSGLTFLTHHESWVPKSGVHQRDRCVHEHLVLRRAPHWLATYDQLNLPNVAGAEALDLRRQLIERAVEASPSAPTPSGADDFLGFQESATGSLIDQNRVAYWASRMFAKAKIDEMARRVRDDQAQKFPVDKAVEKGKGKDKSGRPKPDKGKGDGADP